jgi:putative addiction module CopG family antidote
MEAETMNIHLTPEQERIVNQELESGHFQSAEEVISEALKILQTQDRSFEVETADGAQGEAVREMLSYVQKNCARLEGVSIKDLIHQGHRL